MDACSVPYDALEGCSAEAPQPILEDRSLPAYFPPSRFLIFVFRGTVRHLGQQFHTRPGMCEPAPARSVHRAFRRRGAPLAACSCGSFSSGKLVRGTPESQLLSFPIAPRLLLSKSPSSSPHHRHWLSPKFHARGGEAAGRPQTHSAGSCRLRAVGAAEAGCSAFFHNYKNKMCSLQKTKNTHADQN